MKKRMVTDSIVLLFIMLFVYAALSKFLDYEKFRMQLAQSPLLTAFSPFISVAIPAMEILISILLAIPALKQYGLYASLCLMSMFTAYIIAILNFSTFIPCSCGGILETLSWQEHLVFNLVFTMMAATGIILEGNSHSVKPAET